MARPGCIALSQANALDTVEDMASAVFVVIVMIRLFATVALMVRDRKSVV